MLNRSAEKTAILSKLLKRLELAGYQIEKLEINLMIVADGKYSLSDNPIHLDINISYLRSFVLAIAKAENSDVDMALETAFIHFDAEIQAILIFGGPRRVLLKRGLLGFGVQQARQDQQLRH